MSRIHHDEGIPLLTADVARLADVTPHAVQQWHRRGLLTARRTATGVRIFDQRTVVAFLERRAVHQRAKARFRELRLQAMGARRQRGDPAGEPGAPKPSRKTRTRGSG